MRAVLDLIRQGYEILAQAGEYCWVSRGDRDWILRWHDGVWVIAG